jgi:hypothetical protein
MKRFETCHTEAPHRILKSFVGTRDWQVLQMLGASRPKVKSDRHASRVGSSCIFELCCRMVHGEEHA